uniref:Uncharacterized protein n=1 Tax=Arundo donax TaxID=35708 RepID=A0A0A9CND4_ARUDO
MRSPALYRIVFPVSYILSRMHRGRPYRIWWWCHGSSGIPSTFGAVNTAGITQLILVDRHDTSAMDPPPTGFAVPPAALLRMKSLAVYPLLKLRVASPAEVGVHGEGRARADLPAAAAEGVGVGVLAVRVPADRAPVQRRLGAQIQELRRRQRRRGGGGARRLRLRLGL